MSHTSTGTIFKTPSGKYLRLFRVQSHVGHREYVQETPDITCATVARGVQLRDLERLAQKEGIGELTRVEVEVTRDIKILCEGNQPSLPI